MSVKTVTDLLVADAQTTSVVADRITPVNRTSDMALPAITLNLISTSPTIHLKGDTLFDHERIQVDCWATTYIQAHAIADQTRRVVEAAGHTLAMQMDDFDENAELSGVFRVIQEYDVWVNN